MMMKAVVVLTFTLLMVLECIFPHPKMLTIVAPPMIFGLVATIHSRKRGISYLNELPNALRVLFASVGAALASIFSPFTVIVGLCFVLLGLFVNDEAIRRLYRHKGVIVLAGIDSTGKSTHALNISSWLKHKGIEAEIVPFHKYLFLEKLSRQARQHGTSKELTYAKRRRTPLAKTSRFSFIRPYLALIDNVIFYCVKVLPHVVMREYVVCDRFIWDNYIKHKALGYETRFLFRLSTLIRPKIGIVLDLPARTAFERVERREKHMRYSLDQYEIERLEFRKIARMMDYPVIRTDESIQKTWLKIQAHLNHHVH